jgi:hypothetical protein
VTTHWTDKPRDPCGVPYDRTWTDGADVAHYTLDHALGGAEGPAAWTSEHDCNPVCGCHLASKCLGCGVCTSCDGCYCREDW